MVNGGNGKRGVDYGEFFPCFRSSASWFDYLEPYEKFSCRIHYLLVVHTLVSIMDDHHEIEWSCYQWTGTIHAHGVIVGLLSS